MVIENFEQLIDSLKINSEIKTVAVICANDTVTLKAVFYCQSKGILKPILIGEKEKMGKYIADIGESSENIQIIEESDLQKAAEKGVSLVKEGKADFIMKGKIDTSILLRAVVSKETGLGIGKVMSHLAFLEIPNYHKLIVLTDSGMIIKPDFEQKKSIIENVVETLTAIGYDKPKIGLLAAVEKINPKMPETVDASKLVELNRNGTIKGCFIEGPISYDVLMSKESAEKKGYKSEIVGDADVMVVGDMATGNILGKALSYSAEAKMAGIIVGAKVPIALTSRGANVEEKINSLLLAAACCR
ncbi:MAG: phosphate acyltransferase [Sedimentibacter sp.]